MSSAPVLSLIAQFLAMESRLALAERGVRALDDPQTMRRTLAALRVSIAAHPACAPGDRRAQIAFFLNRARKAAAGDTRDLDQAIALLGLEGDGLACVSAPSVASRRIARTRAGASFAGSLLDFALHAPDRVSIVDTRCQYLATSGPNAIFYDRTQADLMGLHVGDVIGKSRFEGRAKRFLERCFSGHPVEYHHGQHVGDAFRLMRCQMQPVRSCEDAAMGAMVIMTDVTESYGAGLPEDLAAAH